MTIPALSDLTPVVEEAARVRDEKLNALYRERQRLTDEYASEEHQRRDAYEAKLAALGACTHLAAAAIRREYQDAVRDASGVEHEGWVD